MFTNSTKLVEPIYVSITIELSKSITTICALQVYESIPNCLPRTNSFVRDVPAKHTLTPRQYLVNSITFAVMFFRQ